MQTLLFDTTLKTAKLYERDAKNSPIVYSFTNVPTVKVKEEGFYEVIQKISNEDGIDSNLPVARFPIQNTNMIIEK